VDQVRGISATRRKRLIIFAFVTLLGLFLQGCGTSQASLTVGADAPAFTLPTSAGGAVSLADYRGRQPVLLYFHMAVG
jgi:hypothetical protein